MYVVFPHSENDFFAKNSFSILWLIQDCSIAIANTLEMLQSGTRPSYHFHLSFIHSETWEAPTWASWSNISSIYSFFISNNSLG